MQDPASTLSWLNQQAGIDAKGLTTKLLDTSTFSQPQFALDNLDLLANQTDKESISYSIYSAFLRKNNKKAENFLQASPYKKSIEERHKLMLKYREQ